MQVNILEAKTDFSKLIRLLENGRESSIVIAKHGRPVAQLTAYKKEPVENRIGIAEGLFKSPKDLDMDNAEIATLFGGGL